jgi:8-oxo-dGTP pyrophosphatase MutT (NUDIX family)
MLLFSKLNRNGMKRNLLLNLLGRYEAEPKMKVRLEQFVKECPDCFERSNLAGHITSSCWLVSKDGQKVLLTHHRKLNMWLQPGGHCDGDGDVIRVALKEAGEETGIDDWRLISKEIFDIDIHVIPGRKDEPEHYHYDVRFLFVAQANEDYIVSEESHDLAWVELNKLSDYTDEFSMHRMCNKWQELSAAGNIS